MEALKLNPRRRTSKKKTVVTLVLTSLVDAFSIMLLYLLFQSNGAASTFELMKSENLPTAMKAEALHQGTVVRIEDGRYFISEEEIGLVGLAARLQELRATQSGEAAESLIIQADKNTDFSMLAPIIRAASVSGFNKYRFAVLQGEATL
jgi:biopolymer transport protein ExbD